MKLKTTIGLLCALLVSTANAEDLNKYTAKCNSVIFQLGYLPGTYFGYDSASYSSWEKTKRNQPSNFRDMNTELVNYNNRNSSNSKNHITQRGDTYTWGNGCSYRVVGNNRAIFKNGIECHIEKPEGLSELKCEVK